MCCDSDGQDVCNQVYEEQKDDSQTKVRLAVIPQSRASFLKAICMAHIKSQLSVIIFNGPSLICLCIAILCTV